MVFKFILSLYNKVFLILGSCKGFSTEDLFLLPYFLSRSLFPVGAFSLDKYGLALSNFKVRHDIDKFEPSSIGINNNNAGYIYQ